MPKFKCEYEYGELSDCKIWMLTIEADDHRQAYEKFIKELGPEWKTFDFFNTGIHPSKPQSTGLTIVQRA